MATVGVNGLTWRPVGMMRNDAGVDRCDAAAAAALHGGWSE